MILYAALLVVVAGYLALRHAAFQSVGKPDESALFQGNPAALLPPGLRIVTGLKMTAVAVSKRFVPVRLGVDDGQNVEVLEGLHGGEWVALNLGTDVPDGAAVRVQTGH